MIPSRVFPVQAILPSVFSTADPSSLMLLGMTREAKRGIRDDTFSE
jgi:hypothetical protein